jgi:PAS domain S-box-containing protein
MPTNPKSAEKRNEFLRKITCDSDIKKKNVKKLLIKKKQELECILDSSPTIIFYKNKAGKIIQANSAFADALKVNKKQLVGKTVFDLYSSEIAQSMTNDDLEVIKSKRAKLNVVEPYESPTGLRWLRTSKVPILNQKGNVTGIIGFSEDITENKKAEQELVRSERRINEILESITDDFMVLDFNWNFIYANRLAANILGLEPKDIVGKNFWELFPQNKGTFIEQNLRDAMEKREIRRFELSGQFSKRDKLITTYPSAEGIALIATDITERKNLQKRLQENERFAAIGHTAGMVGHDIRNPLQAIIGDTYILREEISGVSDVSKKNAMIESLESIEANIKYINKIVADLQDYAKELKPDFYEIDFLALVDDVVKDTHIPNEINVTVTANTFRTINADPTFLRRIITNLITNAIQAMPNSGELEVTFSEKDKKALITVADTGVGIPEDVKSKLFTPMMTTKAKGQGLGLAVVKRLVEALNGKINFESEIGKGTKFIIELPMSNPKIN